MDKEVDEIMDDDDSSESEAEHEDIVRKHVLTPQDCDSGSDSDSLSGDLPRGWKLWRKSFSRSPQHNDHEDKDVDEKQCEAEDDEETENELERYEKNMIAFGQADSDLSDDSIGSVDDEIADAVEREFLSGL